MIVEIFLEENELGKKEGNLACVVPGSSSNSKLKKLHLKIRYSVFYIQPVQMFFKVKIERLVISITRTNCNAAPVNVNLNEVWN